MKRLILIAVIAIETILFAQAPDTLWTKTFGGSGFEVANHVQQTSDNGYIIVGQASSFSPGDADLWLIKTDANGDTMWTKIYRSGITDEGFSVQQTFDGGYIITGVYNGNINNSSIWLIKTDSNGDSLWTKTYGQNFVLNVGYSVKQTMDSGYVILGVTRGGTTAEDVWLIKTDAVGEITWTKTHGGQFKDVGYEVQQTTDGGYIVTGESASFGEASGDIWLLKTDANGDFHWQKTWGDFSFDTGRSVYQTSDSGYVITGYYKTAFTNNLWLARTDKNGDTLWTKQFNSGFTDDGYSVRQTSDGGFIVTGITALIDGDYIWLIKTNADGDTLWTKTFGGSGLEYGYSVQQTTDGGYIVAGFTSSFGSGGYDAWLIKVEGDITSIDKNRETIVSDYLLKQNYPNPFNPGTTIEFSLPESGFVRLTITNILGELIETLISEERSAGNYKTKWNASGYSSGVYLAQLQAGNFKQSRKIVLQK